MATPTKATSLTASDGKMIGPRNLLVVIALLELIAVLWDFLFGRMSILFRNPLEPAGPGIADVVTRVHIVCHPLLVLAALAFAVTGRLRHAIVALGAVELMRWLNLVLWIKQSGLRLDDGYDIQWTVAQIFLFPLMATGGIALSALDTRPGLAAVLTSAPTLYNLAGVTLYASLILINGL